MLANLDQVELEYRRRTPRSRGLHARACQSLTGGDTRSITYYLPYPAFIQSGQGCRITDADGNQYLDVLNNYTSMIHGHTHPRIVDAVRRQLDRGTAFAAPIECQIELADMLCGRVPSLERVRFCNSGTEATMNAIRLAKAFTGRNKIIKMEGGYHGTHDAVEVSVAPPPELAGPASAPYSVAALDGVFRGILADVVVAPFNDIPSTRALIEAHSDDLAAIIVEPVMSSGGAIPADREYLEFLRSATRQCGALLIFDEVVTFRLAYGGAQEIYGITPDLTSLGKLIGGGFPVGGFGGRAEIMSWLDPSRQRLFQNGTFNGNAVTMAAGIVALELLTREEIGRINRLGDRLRRGLANEFSAHGVDAQVSGLGSMLQIHLTAEPVIQYRSVAGLSKEAQRMLHLSLLNRGIFAAPRNSMSLSTAMGEPEVDEVIGAVAGVLTEARQWVAAG